MEEKADFESLCDTHIGENHMVGKCSLFKPESNYVLKFIYFFRIRLTKLGEGSLYCNCYLGKKECLIYIIFFISEFHAVCCYSNLF